MAAIRQVSASRGLDVRQGIDLVNAVGRLSPFDKVGGEEGGFGMHASACLLPRPPALSSLLPLPPPNPNPNPNPPPPLPHAHPPTHLLPPPPQVDAAVAVHGALLRAGSLPVLLDACFKDEAERENVLLRLGLRITEDGGVEVRGGRLEE